MSKYFVYGLVDPRTGELRYIGKTANGMKRPESHLHPSKLRTHTYKNHWIKLLLSLGLKPIIVVLKECAKDNLVEMEKYSIAQFRAEGAPLTNATDGGEGAAGRKDSELTRTKKSEALKGRTHSPLHRARVSAAMRIAKRSRPFLETNSGQRFETQAEAAQAFGLDQAHISRVLRGTLAHRKGYVFRYIGVSIC